MRSLGTFLFVLMASRCDLRCGVRTSFVLQRSQDCARPSWDELTKHACGKTGIAESCPILFSSEFSWSWLILSASLELKPCGVPSPPEVISREDEQSPPRFVQQSKVFSPKLCRWPVKHGNDVDYASRLPRFISLPTRHLSTLRYTTDILASSFSTQACGT